MEINEYQLLAMKTLNPKLDKKDILINGVMGLCGEAGEAIDIVKKHLAQGHELHKDKLVDEGECLALVRVPVKEVFQMVLTVASAALMLSMNALPAATFVSNILPNSTCALACCSI